MIKKLIVPAAFLFFASHAFGAGSDVYLLNQSGSKTTQFAPGEEVYIEGTCLPSSGGITKVYITEDKNWASGGNLSDLSGGIETFNVAGDGAIPKTLIWKSPYQGAFDVAIDTNNDLVLHDFEQQCVIGLTGAGFLVGSPQIVPPPPPPPSPTPPAIQPTPTPPPVLKTVEQPSQPSQSFSLNDIVEVKSLSNVRKSAGGSLLGTQAKGAIGEVVGGPARASLGGVSYWFWNIDFDEGVDGWVMETTLKEGERKEPEPTPEEKLEEPIQAPIVESPAVEAQVPEKAETSLAQASSANRDSLMGAVVIGLAILLGFVLGSFIIAKSLRRVG